MPWITKDETESEFFAELTGLPDRTAGLLCMTILDDRLTEAIQAHWHDTKIEKEPIFDRLFGYSGPLGSFGTRINLGYAIGLYGETAARDLHLVRRIRNKFAHKLTHRDFSHNEIKPLTFNLKLLESFPIAPKSEDGSYTITVSTPVTMHSFAEQFCVGSSVTDMSDPRSRYIRTTELLSIFLFAAAEMAKKKDPFF